MGSPVSTPAPARRAFQLQTAVAVCHQKTRRSSSRVPPSVQGAGLPSFFFYRKKKEAKPLRAKSRRYAAVALRDAAAAAERLPPERTSAFCGRRPGGIPPYGRERDLGSPTGASIACASLRDRSAPSAPPALTGRFAFLRARGLRPTLWKGWTETLPTFGLGFYRVPLSLWLSSCACYQINRSLFFLLLFLFS